MRLRGVVVEHALERALEHLHAERELACRACARRCCARPRAGPSDGAGSGDPRRRTRRAPRRAVSQNAAVVDLVAGPRIEDRVRQRRGLDAALGRAAGCAARRAAVACRRTPIKKARTEPQPRDHAAMLHRLGRGPALPHRRRCRASAACLRTSDDDFVVDEEPAYVPRGYGRSRVRADREARADDAEGRRAHRARARRASRATSASPGMKDRHAVTRQWLSLPPPVTPEAAQRARARRRRVLEAARHPHKLRTGHVRANRFVLRVRGRRRTTPPHARARSSTRSPKAARRAELVRRAAVRHGTATTRRAACAIVRGEQRPPRDRKLARLLVSALQSRAVQRLARRAARAMACTRRVHRRRHPAQARRRPCSTVRGPERPTSRGSSPASSASPGRCSAIACARPPDGSAGRRARGDDPRRGGSRRATRSRACARSPRARAATPRSRSRDAARVRTSTTTAIEVAFTLPAARTRPRSCARS